MFHLQGLVFIALLCAARAAVIVNAYLDDIESTKVQDVDSCDLRECEQSCRRIGFPGGACVGDHCKCDIMEEDIEPNELQAKRGCDFRECDQLCRRIGFPGGACVGDRCKCDIIERERIKSSKIVNECNDNTCNQLCQRMGFFGGRCVNRHCKCEFYTNIDSNDLQAIRACDFRECNQLCRRIGFPGGACVGDRCKCDIIERGVIENNDDIESNKCHSAKCNELCQLLGFKGGVCSGDTCRCLSFNQKDAVVVTEKDSRNDISANNGPNECNENSCKMSCQFRKYEGGDCFGSQCKCYTKQYSISQVTTTINIKNY